MRVQQVSDLASLLEIELETGRTYEQMAVLYRTNAQSRVFEDVFIRTGMLIIFLLLATRSATR